MTEQAAGARLDVFVAGAAGVSRVGAGRLIDGGHVLVNDRPGRKSTKIAAGDAIAIDEPEAARFAPPEGVDVVFEDDALLVVNKPAGVVVHAAPGVREGTLVDALEQDARTLAARAGADRPGIVHRLDRDVSGLLVVAKTDDSHRSLTRQMTRREIERRYKALVAGTPSADRGKIDAPIGRDPKHRARMSVVADGRPSVTWFAVSERFDHVRGDTPRTPPRATLLDVRLETGRTHQIRTHLASIALPIVGDAVYGRDPGLARALGLERPFLHAYRLAFEHPVSGERVDFEAALPSDLDEALRKLRS